MKLSQGICDGVDDMLAFIPLKVPILGESFLAQPNQRRVHAHKSLVHFCHDMDPFVLCFPLLSFR